MFVRVKSSGGHQYLQVVENERDGTRVKQCVVTTLGRLDRLQAAGAIDSLLLSLGRFSEKVRVLEAHRAGAFEARSVTRIGADLVFGRLWETLGPKLDSPETQVSTLQGLVDWHEGLGTTLRPGRPGRRRGRRQAAGRRRSPGRQCRPLRGEGCAGSRSWRCRGPRSHTGPRGPGAHAPSERSQLRGGRFRERLVLEQSVDAHQQRPVFADALSGRERTGAVFVRRSGARE